MLLPTSRRSLRIFATIWVAFALVCLGLTSWDTWNRMINGVDTDAVIVQRNEMNRGVDLVVDYATNDGRSVRARLTEYSHPELHEPGQTMRIRYVPSAPLNPRQADEPMLTRIPLFVIGGVLLFTGAGTFVYAWWYAPKNLRYAPRNGILGFSRRDQERFI